jgi:uncharacterized membrane protein
MRDKALRRIIPAVFLTSTAVIAGWLRIRPQREPNPDRPAAAPLQPTVTPLPEPGPTPAPSASSTNEVPARFIVVPEPSFVQIPRSALAASLWFGAAIVLCIVAAGVVSSAQQTAFHDLAPLFAIAVPGLIVAGIGAAAWLKRDQARRWPRWLWRFSLLFAAIIVSFIAADINFTAVEFDGTGQLGSVLLWLLAIGLAFAAAGQRSDPTTVKLTEPIRRSEVIVFIAIVALAFALRAIDLEHIPGVVLGDETKYAVAARYLTEHQQIKPFTTGSDGHWNFYLQIIGLFLQLFGQTITAMRLPSVLAGILGIVALYAVVRQLWGRRPALIAAALMATYHQNIHYSRVGFNSIDDPLFLALVFGCAWLAWRTGRRRAWLMTALAAGLSQYFFVGGRLVLLQLAVLAVFWLITDRHRVRAQALNIAVAVSVFICIITPILYFWAIRPNDYMSSLNAKNIYRSGWVPAAMQANNESEVDVLWGQLRDVMTSFSFGSDEGFYWAQTMLTPIMSILAVIALAYFVAHSREGPYFWVVSSLALVILFGGILMVSPTAGSHRLLGSSPLIYGAIAVAIDRAWGWFERRAPHPKLIGVYGLLVIALLMNADARYYFVNYLTKNELRSPDVPFHVIQEYLFALEPRTEPQPLQIVCVGLNADFCRGTTLDFLARPLLARADVITDLPSTDSVPPRGTKLQVVIINASMTQEVERARQRYATVTPQNLSDPLNRILFVAFEIQPYQ